MSRILRYVPLAKTSVQNSIARRTKYRTIEVPTMAKNVGTLPVDSNIESKEAKAGGNLAQKAYSEMGGAKAEKRRSTSSYATSGKEILVASNAQGIMKMPVPNEYGTVGPAPMEITDPKQFRTAPSRDINLHDTSIDKAAYEERERSIQKMRETIGQDRSFNVYPWKSIGGFFGSGSGPASADGDVVKAYITEKFYNDIYFNMAGIVGTCYFSWLLAHWRFSWLSLFFVFFCAASVYRSEFRRFNRNIRDDLTRIVVEETLSDRKESTLWLNSFLSKFWVIYMPVLSQQVKDIANPQLADVAPGYGIDAISLDEFNLGTKSPTIDGITSYTKRGKDTVEMDWEFSFTPSDVSNMTQNEAKEKINPKIAMGVTVGKGFVSKSLPVLVEDVNCKGRMRITIKFGHSFPNIKIVSLSLMEPPFIDFALKPVGGDTLGLDIMSFLPGLKTFVKTMINSNVGPMLYNPHTLDIDVEEIMAAQSQDAIGVVAVTLHSADELKSSDFLGNTVDPYVTLTTENGNIGETTIRTSVKSNIKSPRWNETKYVLINSLEQKMFFTCFDFNDIRKDTLIGKLEFNLATLLQTPSITDQSSKLTSGGRTRGTLNYDLHWLPVISEETRAAKEDMSDAPERAELDDDTEAEQSASDVGILKATFHKAKFLKALGSLQGALSPSALMMIDGKVVKKYRTLRRINEPSWEECIEVLVPSKKNSVLTIKVFDDGMAGKELLCEYSSSMSDILSISEGGQTMLAASPQGELYLSTVWKPVAMTGSFAPANSMRDPLGVVKLHIKDGLIDEQLSGVGDIDPYITVSLNKHVTHKTQYIPDNREPKFNTIIYVPVTSENQSILLKVMDYQKVGKDRPVGSYTIPVSKVAQKDPETNKYVQVEKAQPAQCRLLGKNMALTKSYINVDMSFIPVTPVYNPDELSKVEQLEAKIKERKEKFNKEQEEMKKAMEEHPDQYEVVEVEIEDEQEKSLKKKEKKTVEELLRDNSGVLDYQILSGKLSKRSAHLQVLFDDLACPTSTSLKSKNEEVVPDSGSCFIRDLNHSRITFRLSKKYEAKDLDDILGEESFSVKELLKKGLKAPTLIKAKGSELEVRFFYTPAKFQLPATESIEDTGSLKLNVISAEGLPSHDRNNKSDPFVVIKVDGSKVGKTDVIKKTLSPVWNANVEVPIPSRSRCEVAVEVYDWDRAGSNDLLCSTVLDTKMLVPGKTHDLNLDLDSQGSIKMKATFTPEYLFPALDPAKGGLAVMPFKAIDGVANIGVGVAGAGLGAAQNVAGAGFGAAQNVAGAGFGGVQKGGKFLKGLGRKSKKESRSQQGSDEATESESQEDESRPKASKKSMDYDVTKPNNSYAEVRHSSDRPQDTATSPKNGEGSSVVGAPGPIHKRSTSTASSFARTLAPSDTYRGKVTVLGAENMGKASLQVRVSLAQSGRIRHMYRTDNQKTDSEGRVQYTGALCEFKASPEANLVFGAVATHRFGKDTELGVAQVNLGDSQIQQEGTLSLKLGRGHLLLKIEYGDTEVPPVPDIPSEYKTKD
ncbi:LANO_0G13586g1_1 [Lachancea nothofagi CBS 11611]|uniref:LANO_0G13586g1_1 n=1 Tax=Lachancea nothofagi CBS 11611 TaxID=1266666 RepID=A0A1G4KJY6_9SACH|nr:LANO_0G13586g1_1 [Lachancea nothofagi CBS 11611]